MYLQKSLALHTSWVFKEYKYWNFKCSNTWEPSNGWIFCIFLLLRWTVVCVRVYVCVCVCVYVYVCVYSDAVAKYSSFYSDQLHVALAVYQS